MMATVLIEVILLRDFVDRVSSRNFKKPSQGMDQERYTSWESGHLDEKNEDVMVSDKV